MGPQKRTCMWRTLGKASDVEAGGKEGGCIVNPTWALERNKTQECPTVSESAPPREGEAI